MSNASPDVATASHDADALPREGTTARPLRRGFWALFAAFFVANLGSGITSVAFPWLTSSLTRDPLLIAGVPIAAELPWLLFSLPVGAMVDRYDQRRMITITHAARAVLVALVTVVIITGTVTVLMLYLFAFALGTLTVANENATQTLLPRVVPKSALERANGRLIFGDTVGGLFLGPLIGGALLAVSLSLPFALDAALFLVAALLMLAVRPRESTVAPVVHRPPMRAEIAEGLRYYWRHPVLRDLGIFLALLNLASAIVMATQVLYAQEILGVGPTGYGLLFAAGAVGGTIGAWAAAPAEERLGARFVLLMTLAGSTICTLAIGLTSSAFVVGLAIAGSALLAVMWNVVTVSYRQRIVPEGILGRVNSIYRLLSWGPLPLGSLLGGLLVTVGAALTNRTLGLRTPLLFAAIVTFVLLLVALRLRGGVWSKERRVQEYRDYEVRKRSVVLALVAVNGIVAVVGLALLAVNRGLTADAALFDGISVVHELGEMHGPSVDAGEVWRVFTSMFVHYGLVHLLANMVMLIIAGWILEPLLGGRRFLTLYIACGVAAGVVTYLLAHDVRTAGASGATFGVFAALLVTCLSRRRSPIVAIVLLVLAVGGNFAIPGMAMEAHAAGLATGALLAGWFMWWERRQSAAIVSADFAGNDGESVKEQEACDVPKGE